eukprot:SAG22_NODE_4876_length_1144_cov_1.330144_3_plen_80_part_01
MLCCFGCGHRRLQGWWLGVFLLLLFLLLLLLLLLLSSSSKLSDKATHGSFANFTKTVLEPAQFKYTDDDTMAATIMWTGG